MKRSKFIVSILALFFVGLASVWAIPARPGSFKYTQPDGSVITLQLHGDEFFNWTTASDGTVVAKDAQGFYRKAARQRVRRTAYGDLHRSAFSGGPRGASISSGEHRFLVIMVQFSDLKFSLEDPEAAFTDQLNKNGYSGYGAVGSVKDYFMDNSSGKFIPSFDVYGPASLTNSYKYYGGDKDGNQDVHATDGFMAACRSLDSQIDFSLYDEDKDGVVDNIYFIYAGFAQSDGAGDDYIWPHSSSFYGSTAITLDGVKLGKYACGEELTWNGGKDSEMIGIGTFCHEFGHVIGLPDLYDVDDEEHGYNSEPTWAYSLMDSGCYNSGGRIPTYLSWMERGILGWMAEPQAVTSSCSLSIPNISSNVAYKIETDNPGECFVLECRDGSKWDKGQIPGMLVYHMDKSETQVDDRDGKWNFVPTQAWKDWHINIYGGHPCFYIVPAVANPTFLDYVPFPGKAAVTSYVPVAWSGDQVPAFLTEISFAGGKVSCNVEIDNRRIVYGRVTDTAGNPIQGAEISVSEASSEPSSAMSRGFRMRSSGAIRSAAIGKVVTDSNGEYSIDISSASGSEFMIAASHSGYISQSETFTLRTGRFKCDFFLREVGEVIEADLFKFGDYDEQEVTGIGASKTDYSAAVRFYPDELASCVGGVLESVTFAVGSTKATSAKAYVIIEIGSRRVLTKPVDNPKFGGWITVSLKEDNITVPRGESLLVGYGLKGFNTSDFPLLVDKGPVKDGGNLLSTSFSQTATAWYALSDLNPQLSYNFLISAKVGGSSSQLGNAGYNYINDPKSGHYKSGDRFSFSLIESKDAPTSSVEWYFDGAKMSAAGVELVPGDHVIEARMSLKDGRRQTVSMDIKVE